MRQGTGVPNSTRLPFRVLRWGLKAASRAGGHLAERMTRHEGELGPVARQVMDTVSGRPAPAEAGEVEVRFGERVARVRRGVTLLEAAERAGVELRHYCGGNCSCGTCRVEVRAGGRGLSRAEPMETLVLGAEAAARGDRLACQAVVREDVTVHVPDWF
jgi:2Fe-2S ferredoxin